jgi:hypothetical protein
MLADDFRADPQGRRYADVLKMPGFDYVLAFFGDVDRRHRMIDSELHHDRPPLAGVVRELERDEKIRKLYAGLSKKEAVRFRQAVGVIVRLVMAKEFWKPTRTRGSLKGLSEWFSRPERYIEHEF